MKTPSYTKWFSYQPGEKVARALDSQEPVSPGAVIAEAKKNTHEPEQNGGEDSLDCGCTIPPGKDAAGRVVPILAEASVSLTVDDWGSATINGEMVVNLTRSAEKPGKHKGHLMWSGSASRSFATGASCSMSAEGSNISMPHAQYNQFVFNCSMRVVAMENGGDKTPANSCPCGGNTCSFLGGTDSPTRVVRTSGGLSLPRFTTSSSASSVEAETTESRMYWSCTTGNLRGLGALLSGSVEILAEEMSAELAKPAALRFNHPMAAHLVLPEGGLVPGERFSLVNGAREIVFRYYDDGSITPVGVDTSGGGQASLSDEEGDKVFTWQDNAGNAWAFSATTGGLLSYSTDDGVGIGNVAEYLAVVRNPEDDSLRQIWSYWDGLLNIENVTGSGYTVALYTPAQVSGRGGDGLFTLAEGAVPFKSFEVSYNETDSALTIVQKSAGVPDYPVTWTQDAAGAWSMTKGSGAEAIVISRTRTELEPASLMDSLDVWQLVTETSKAGVVASRVCEVYQSTPVGNLLLTKVEGYGGTQELTTTYTYDGSGNMLTETAPNGMVTEYVYDTWGRLLRVYEPWGAADGGFTRVTQTQYADLAEGGFSPEPSRRSVVYNTPGELLQTLWAEEYAYSSANGIKRVEVRKTAAGTSGTQLTVTETYEGTVENTFARGRVRMSQTPDGVQTWYEYATTDYEGALYTETIETRVNGLPVQGQSTRTVNYISCEGNTLRTEKYVLLADGTWAKISGATNTYDVQNRLTSTVQDNGRSMIQALNCEGNLMWRIDEDGIRTDYAYDSARQLIETTRSEVSYEGTVITPETITEYERDAAGRILTTTTRTGAMTTVTRTAYDLAGRTVSRTDILGRVTTTAYSEDTLTTTVTLPTGATLITTTNLDGSVAREYGTGRREVLYGYDYDNGLSTTTTLADGTLLSRTVTDGYGQTIIRTAPTTIADTVITTSSTYNTSGQLTKQTQGNLAPVTYAYDSMGNPIRQTVLLDSTAPADATKNRITDYVYSYEQLEDCVYQVTTTTAHNAAGGALVSIQKNLISQLSPTLAAKTVSTDIRGNTSTQWTEYGGGSVRTTYAAIPTSDITATAVTVDGFTTSTTDNTGVTTTSTRAWAETGMTLTTTDGRGNTTTTRTDIAGRTVSVTDAAGFSTNTSYCEDSDQPSVVTNALGQTSCYRYDLRNRKTAEFGTALQPALFGYDEADNLTALTTFRVDAETLSGDPAGRTDGDTTRWSYDPATGLELTKTYPDNTQVTTTYDSMNRVASITNARGIIQTRAYATATGLLTSITFSDATTPQSFAYNILGQPTQVTDAAGTRTFTYNDYGDQLTDSVRVNTTDFPIEEQYDTYGRSSGYILKRSSAALQTIACGYNSKGRLSTCAFLHGGAEKTFTYQYLEGTDLTASLTAPNNITRHYTYEEKRDLIATLNDKRGSSGVVERSYEYNALGIPTARTISRQGTTRRDSFTHNDRSELTAATMGGKAFAYDYDNIGNRKTAQEETDDFTYTANALNQYTQITENAEPFVPEFDADGNQTRIKTTTGIWTAIYNALNRPVTYTRENADGTLTVITADYDYMGRRVCKKVETVTPTAPDTENGEETRTTITNHRFLYRGYLQIAALNLTRSTLNDLWLITWDPTEPVATRPLAIQQSGTWYIYGTDLPKNVTELYSTSGYIHTAYTYSPYGLVTASGNITQPIQWSSEYTDTDLGLIYYNYRHYNPLNSHWLVRDFITEKEVLNLYTAFENMPFSQSDGLGLICIRKSAPSSGMLRQGAGPILISAKYDSGVDYEACCICCPDGKKGHKISGTYSFGFVFTAEMATYSFFFRKDVNFGNFSAALAARLWGGVRVYGKVEAKASGTLSLNTCNDVGFEKDFTISGAIGFEMGGEAYVQASLRYTRWKLFSKLAKTGVKVGVGFAIGGRINMDWHAKLSCGLMGCSLSGPVDFSLEGTGRMLIFATEVEYSVKQDLVSGGNLSFSLPFGLLA